MMTKSAAVLLFLGAVTVVAGVAMMHVPAAVILAGLLLVAGGVLSLEARGGHREGERR